MTDTAPDSAALAAILATLSREAHDVIIRHLSTVSLRALEAVYLHQVHPEIGSETRR